MIKRIIALIMSIIIFSSICAYGANYDTEGAYQECYTLYPEFIENVIAHGTSEDGIRLFMEYARDYLLSLDEPLTEENADRHIYDAIVEALNYRKTLSVRTALQKAYPDATKKALDGIIDHEFLPIYNTIKRYILGITTPVVILAENDQGVFIRSVRMPEDALFIVAFYDKKGQLIASHINPEGTLPIKGYCAKVFAFEGINLVPLCEKYRIKF